MSPEYYGGSPRAGGVSPRLEPQDTDKGAAEAAARAGANALKPAPKIPRAIQDIIDELNTVRQRRSELWAAEAKRSPWGRGRVQPVGPVYPPYDTESVARSKERDQLSEREDQLQAELREVLAAARIGPGGLKSPNIEESSGGGP
jgi:hypothetical protein